MKKFFIFCFLVLTILPSLISAYHTPNDTQQVFYITLPDNAREYINTTSNDAPTETINKSTTGFVITQQDAIDLYYLVPIVMTIAIVILIIVLVVIARLMHMNTMKHRIKPIINIQQQESSNK